MELQRRSLRNIPEKKTKGNQIVCLALRLPSKASMNAVTGALEQSNAYACFPTRFDVFPLRARVGIHLDY